MAVVVRSKKDAVQRISKFMAHWLSTYSPQELLEEELQVSGRRTPAELQRITEAQELIVARLQKLAGSADGGDSADGDGGE